MIQTLERSEREKMISPNKPAVTSEEAASYPFHYFYALQVLDRRSLGIALVDSGVIGADEALTYPVLRDTLENHIFSMKQFKECRDTLYIHVTGFNQIPTV